MNLNYLSVGNSCWRIILMLFQTCTMASNAFIPIYQHGLVKAWASKKAFFSYPIVTQIMTEFSISLSLPSHGAATKKNYIGKSAMTKKKSWRPKYKEEKVTITRSMTSLAKEFQTNIMNSNHGTTFCMISTIRIRIIIVIHIYEKLRFV